MKHDERNLPLSTDSAEAASLFDRSVEHFLKFHADTMTLAGRAIATDPGFVMGHCLKAYLLLMAANPANRAQIDATLASARDGAARITPREQMHLGAATAWHGGSLDESFRIWGRILDDAPTDLLAFRISDTIWFRHGQTQAILDQADRVAPRWSADLPGYDCCQTIWAFAHEEVGDTNTLLFFPSGAVYPIYGFPAWMRAIATVDPFTYAVHAFKSLLLKNTPLLAIAGDLAFLGIFTVIAMFFATVLFRRTL